MICVPYPSRDCNLAQQVKPARDPRCKWSIAWIRQHSSPEVGTTTSGMRTADLFANSGQIKWPNNEKLLRY